jgi:hypothetical protein
MLNKITHQGVAVGPARYEVGYKCGEFGGP